MAISPSCNVKDGAGAYVAPPLNVTPANTISIQLISVAGVGSWSISCVYTDDLASAATVTAALTIDNLNKVATFTAPVAGRTYIFQSKVNGGVDVNGAAQPSYTTTFGIYTLTAGGARVIAANETVEGNATFGYVASINQLIRNPNAQGDASNVAKGLVQLAGSLGGTAASPTVAQVDGAAGVLPIVAAQTNWGTVAASQVISITNVAAVATTNATIATLITFPIPASSLVDFIVTVCGNHTGGASGAAGDCYRADFPVCYQRIGAAAPSLVGAAAAETNKKSNGLGSGYVGSISVSGNSILIRATGLVTTNIDWSAVIQGQQLA